jgi:hypothetical protein
MSGLEIAGLVAGIVGASARAMTAGKQLSETNFCKHIEKKVWNRIPLDHPEANS